MKQSFVLRRCVLAAGLCLLLVGIITVSLGCASAPSSLPDSVAPRASGEVPRPDRSQNTGGPEQAPPPVTARFTKSAEPSSVSAKVAADPSAAVQGVWERARQAGVYSFAINLTQATYPARTLSNAGRGPQRAEMHMEGELDQSARTMAFRLWQPGSAGSDGAEVRIEGDRAYMRPAGDAPGPNGTAEADWQEIEDFSSSFAPDNDPLAFLAGIKDIADCGLQARAPSSDSGDSASAGVADPGSQSAITCYRFNLDGPALAIYVRDRLQGELTAQGELPPGVALEVPSSLRDMTGNGELWVDGRGLPLRLAMHLASPEERDGSRLEADIQTDFSGFPEQLAAAPKFGEDPLAWTGAALDNAAIDDVAEAGGAGGALACGLGVTALLLSCRRSRRLYAAVVVAVTLSMVIVPLMQSERVAAYSDRQAARSQGLASLGANGQVGDSERAQRPSESRAVDEDAIADLLAPTWDPQHDPLSQSEDPVQPEAPDAPGTISQPGPLPTELPILEGEMSDAPAPAQVGVTATPTPGGLDCDQGDTNDDDNDGVNNYEECVYFTYTFKEDSDADGLSDDQELNKLGTNPNAPDTDGDFLTDLVEVQGFVLPGSSQRWYLDPNNADTNSDGIVDSVECPMLVDPTMGCDTDEDGIPNPFEIDNDADGVPDRVDLSPDQWVDRAGLQRGQANVATPFDGASPLKLYVPGLQGDWPVLVDLQFRPTAATHLGYSMNVLDWPAGDVDGEIQHGKSTTFANSDNPDIRNPDDVAGAKGDMRLVPMLEIVMSGSEIPLKLTAPTATFTVGSWNPAATFTLNPTSDMRNTKVTKTLPAGASYQIYTGACATRGDPVQPVAGVPDAWTGKVTSLADGKHSIVVTVEGVATCAELPDVVNGPYADDMVDTSELDAYGVMVKEGYGADDSVVVAYLPLNVVADDTGGGKTAFQGRMLHYVGGKSHWTQPSQMRVVWLLQAITDSCAEGADTWEKYKESHPDADRTAYDAYLKGYCAKTKNRTMDQITPVQIYDESWYLTGLAVQEAHGLDVAVAYPNPALAYSDDALWTLSWGLGEQFITGRDCENRTSIFSATDPAAPACSSSNTVRDLTVVKTDRLNQTIGDSTIQERFDANGLYSTHRTRWGIPQNALRVESFAYDHQDYVGLLAATVTPGILAKYTDHTLTPSLLFAYEGRSRLGDLSVATQAPGAPLSVDMDPTKRLEQTFTGMKWAPFRWDSTKNAWEAYPSVDYFAAQETDLRNRFTTLFGASDTEATRMGRVATARAYTVALIIGVGSSVLPATGVKPGASDLEIKRADDGMLNSGLNHVTIEVMSDLMDARRSLKANNAAFDLTRNALTMELGEMIASISLGQLSWASAPHAEVSLFAALGDGLLQPGVSPWQAVFTGGPSVPMTGNVLTSLATNVIESIEASELFGLSLIELAFYIYDAGYAAAGLGLIIYGGYTIISVDAAVVQAATSLMGWSRNFLVGAGGVFGVVLTGLTLAYYWAQFALAIILDGLSFGSMAFDQALVEAIAYTIFTIVWFVITTCLGPLGSILSGIKMIVNALAESLCNAFLTEEEQEEKEWTKWVCGGITGFFVQYYEAILYSGTLIADMDPDEDEGPPRYPRLNMYDFRPTLQDERQGVTVGNSMRYSIGITNTIDLSPVPIRTQEAIWFWQFSPENLAKADFLYRWQSQQTDFHDSLSLGGMTWDGTEDGPPYYHAETNDSSNLKFTKAGINLPANLYFSEAYAVPEQECWGYALAKYCYIATEKGTQHLDIGADMFHDVLPATVGDFYALTPKGGGYALSWGQSGHLKFPTLYDADGDGLSALDDPDDRTWDVDSDGLTDSFELTNGLNPRSGDSDNDGLTDTQELRLGTDPWSRDSDGDGLLDCQEIRHQVEAEGDSAARTVCGAKGTWSGGWSIVYKMVAGAQSTTWVTSDPLSADTDGDGISDSKERAYGYNPRAYSVLKVLSLDSTLSEDGRDVSDGYVARGQSLTYNARVRNELDNRHAEGLLSPTVSPALEQSTANPVRPEAFVLRPLAEANMAGNLTVKATAASGTYTLTQVAGALISDRTVESGNPSLWLPFDDPVGSTVFADSSGSQPAHDGQCQGVCTLAPSDGRVGSALRLDGAGYVSSEVPLPNGNYSVSLWFRVDPANGDSGLLFASADSYQVTIKLYEGYIYFTSVTTGGYTQVKYADGKWHHLVYAVPGGTNLETTLYLDGDISQYGQRSSSAAAAQGVLIGGAAGGSRLVGFVDDVRVFNRELTRLEVQQMFEMPIFQMDFNQTNEWKDVSNLPTTVSCANCPGRTTWAGDGAATFDGTQYLSVDQATKLDLATGRFTLSAWVYPRTRGGGDLRDTFPQGILGWNAGEADGYASLERWGRKIRFGLASSSDGWKDLYTSGEVLTENQWNHVALTLDLDKDTQQATLAFYVNGVLVTGTPVSVDVGSPGVGLAAKFEIGRDSNAGRMELTKYYQDSAEDEGARDCGSLAKVEQCMRMGGVEVLNYQFHCAVVCPSVGQDCPPLPQQVDFTEKATVQLWEDDGGVKCGPVPTNQGLNDDDVCRLTSANLKSMDFTTNEAGFTSKQIDFDSCSGDGYFKLKYTHRSIPFYGDLDEVQIYGQPFDQDSIKRLYQDVVTALHLPLDEAPGAVTFQDASLAHVASSCLADANACPTSGTAGRLNQAAWFDGVNDNVRLGNFGDFDTTTVSAWAYRTKASTGRQTIVSYKESGYCGFVLAVENNYPKFWVNVGGAWKGPAIGSSAIPTNKWVHLAGRYDGSNITVWQDGAQVGTVAFTGAMKNCTGNTAIGSYNGNSQHWFPGVIDDVWIFGAALPNERIIQLYEAAPKIHLRFDEASGAQQFADNAGSGLVGTCTDTATSHACPLTGEGVKGQIGLAAQFDGVNDTVRLENFGTFNQTTVSAWVRRTGATAARETIVSYKESALCGFVLDLNDDVAKQLPRFYVNVGGTWRSVTGSAPVPLNQWVHLAGTYDGKTIRLYQNGLEAGKLDVAGSMKNDCTATSAIGSHNSQPQHWFPGEIDQVRIYARALSAKEVRDQFLYEDAWVEDRESQRITVDADPPSAEVLMAPGSYLAGQAIWVGVRASDPTSEVDRVELGVQRGAGAVAWTTAVPCGSDAGQPEGAWCAQFNPPAQGDYGLLARATDRVGNVGPTSSRVTVYVDDSAPTLTLDQASVERLDVLESNGKENSWVVHLSGTVSDPAIASSIAGSGIANDGVRVTLREAGDSNDRTLGAPRQPATISGNTWTLDYEFSEKKADGCYELEVEAMDQVARLPGLDPTQVSRHTTIVLDTVVLDASAPQVLLDQQQAIADGQLGPGVTALGGEATHRPVSVEINLMATAGADQTRILLTCQHGTEGGWYTLFDLQAGALTTGSTQHWEGKIHQESACRVELTTTATPVGGVSGEVKVCGTKIAEWPANFAASQTVEFVAQSDSCGAPGCPVGSAPSVAGVQGVDLAFRPVLPGSAFINEAPPTGEVLHLPFEDTADSTGGLMLRDVSGVGPNGSCGSGACPTTGQIGHLGKAAWFDGKDDYVEVPIDVSETAYALALWFKTTCAACGIFSADVGTLGAGVHDRDVYLDKGNLCARVLSDEIKCTSGTNYADGKWHHLVHTFGGTEGGQKIYVDGVLGISGQKATSDFTAQDGVNIGFSNYAAQYYFLGVLDEVRLFGRALTADDIKALYIGSGPLLALSFEAPWATDGASLADASGWGHDAILHTSDAANKGTTGQVGMYALKLDGVDDYAVIADSDTIGFGGNHDFAVMAWIKPDATQTWTATVDNNVIEKWSGAGGYPYSIRYLNQTAGANAGKISGGRWDGQNDSWLQSTTRIDDGSFHHVALVKSGSTLTFYVDGAQQGQRTDTTSGAATNTSPLYIGRRGGTTLQGYFTGSVDDVRLYPRPLSALEIADHYNAGWQAATLPAGSAGADRAAWTANVPAGLEGSYQIEMRGRDVAGHSGVVGEPSLLWRGEADNLPPRLSVSRQLVAGSTYRYTAKAQDYHLDQTTYSSPCGSEVATLSPEIFKSPWYVGHTGDTQKLYGLTAVCDLAGAPSAATICDSFGNCTSCDWSNNCTTSVRLAAAAGSPSSGMEPSQQTGSPALVGATVPDASAAARPVNPSPAGFDITARTVVTTSQYYEPRTVDLLGLVTARRKPGADQHDLAGVQVAIAGATGQATLSEPAASRPYTVTWTFPWRLQQGSPLPDGVSYTAAITATDVAGRTTAISHMLMADVVLPAPVTLTLAANGRPVVPGETIRETSPDLALTWTPSSDGSGLDSYRAAWRVEDAHATTMQTSLHNPAAQREAHLTAGEAQRVSAGLASRDLYGNERWQAFGSVIVDGPLTPDYIALSPGVEGDITGSACTLLGADRRIARRMSSGRLTSRFLREWTAQRLYGTWDHQALRLAWTGANWSGDGDLFIYLDSGGGGTSTTFTPDSLAVTGTLVTLPDNLQADFLIWVQDASTASLLRWDGSTWAFETPLSAEQYRFDAGRNDGQTDLYLPFELLGLSAGAPLGLLAFAAEEPAEDGGLRVWATLPLANPVNSDRVNIRRVLAPILSTMPLLHTYSWAALDDGVCPNGTNGGLAPEQHNDAALEMTVESDPPGATISGVADGLFWVRDMLADLAAMGTPLRFGVLNAAHAPVPDNQEITYTVHYRNAGTHTLEGAWLALSSRGALVLADDTIELGDIPPGSEGSVTFQGRVDRSLSPFGLAAVAGRLYAAGEGANEQPLEWLVAVHRVDKGAPEEMGLNQQALLVGPAAGRLSGYASDESGVRHVEIEVSSPSGAISTLTCDLPGPASGGWSCPWDATAANGGVRPEDGDEFTVRLRATDRFGQTSPWSASRVIQVDALPPTVTLMSEALAGRVVRGNALRLMGETLDNNAVGSVTVCLDEDTCRTADLGTPGARASWWSRWIVARGALDHVTKTVTIQATDRLGNSLLEPTAVDVVFDNVPPVLVANQILTQAPLSSAEMVLNGDVGDGGPEVEVSVRVQAPTGDETRAAAARDGATWWFNLPADMPGQYTLWADAKDLAGNVTTAGPFTVDVTCTDAAPIVASVTPELLAGSAVSLTLTTVISNTGPDLLPAGIPLTLSEGGAEIGRVATTVPLGSGESQAFSLIWAPTGGMDYDITATFGQNGDLPNAPLCTAPPTARFSVPVRDQVLYHGWNLISPPVNPSNTDVQAVQQGIDGPYTVLLGYDGGLWQTYHPDRPGDSTLSTVDARHGYWIHVPPASPTDPPTDDPPASWRMAGEILPEGQQLPLAAGWNLAGYLPQQPLTVTQALEDIAGQYGAVLGFEGTAASYYPDLDASYDTLYRMAPGYGYWIRATQAITLQYPVTGITNTLPVTATLTARHRLDAIQLVELEAGVQPTYEWMNFYGEVSLPDGTGVPTGTVVLAVDPQGVICGATTTWEIGQYGLLACYGDDPDTSADEGALPGDTIRLVVGEGTPPQPGSWVIGEGTWTAHGARQQAPEGPPLADLAISKHAQPAAAAPGDPITYTLAFTNQGSLLAVGVTISDPLPLEITDPAFISSGADITLTLDSPAFAWQVADLGLGEGGVITVTGTLSPALTSPLTITNTAAISATNEMRPADNLAEAVLQVLLPPPSLQPVIWLPLIMQGGEP